MQILVNDVERRTSHRKCEHGCDQGDACQSRGSVLKDLTRDRPAGPYYAEDGDKLPKQLRPTQGDAASADESGHPCIEDRCFQL